MEFEHSMLLVLLYHLTPRPPHHMSGANVVLHTHWQSRQNSRGNLRQHISMQCLRTLLPIAVAFWPLFSSSWLEFLWFYVTEVVADVMFIAGLCKTNVVLLEIKIYHASKLRDVRMAQFMSELLPVLMRFPPQPNDRPNSREVCKVKQVKMG